MNNNIENKTESLIKRLEGFRDNHRTLMNIVAQASREQKEELICSHFKKISGAEETALFLIDEKSERFRFRAAAGKQAYRYAGGFFQGDLRSLGEFSLKAAHSENITVQTEKKTFVFDDVFIAVVPISSFSKILGLFLCEYGEAYTVMDNDTMELINVFLDQLSFLFESFVEKRKLEEKARSLELLYEIGNKLSSIRDEDQLLETVLQLIEKYLQVDRCSLMIMDEERKNLKIKKTIGIPDVDISKVKIPLGVGISGYVAMGTRPLLIKDLSAEEHLSSLVQNKENFRTNSLLSVPLVTQGEVIGVINVNNRKDGQTFSEEDMELLSKIASEIAVVLKKSYISLQLKKARELDGDIKRFMV